MHVKPPEIVDRDVEWRALVGAVERRGRFGLVYGPRRAGKSFLLDAVCRVVGGWRYQAAGGTGPAQLDDLARALGEWQGVGPLRLSGWADALQRIAALDAPVVVLDELPYLVDAVPELPGLLQRHVDAGQGPPIIVCGSAMSTMASLVEGRAPLYGRASVVVVPRPFAGRDLAALWDASPTASLWVDAALGGLPGYRPMTRPPTTLDRWMVDHVLAPTSPFLDAAEAALGGDHDGADRGLPRAILAAIASGNRSFANVARVAGVAATALSRPIRVLERSGLVRRIPDPLRDRRDLYDLADPHLRFWLTLLGPNRSQLSAGRAAAVWAATKDSTWPAQILGPRWESVAREHLEKVGVHGRVPGTVGMTVVADRAERRSHEVDLVAVDGDRVIALGEAKLRRLTLADAERLRRVRALMGADCPIVLASATGVDKRALAPDVMVVTPAEVYG